MLAAKGIYENGEIKLLEDIDLEGRYNVVITFLEEANEAERHRKGNILRFAGIWADLSEEEEEILDDILKSRGDFSLNREVEL